MKYSVREICRVIAYEVVRLVEIDRKRVLSGMVDRTSKTYYRILSRLKREIISVTWELPYGLDKRNEIDLAPRVGACRVVWRKRTEAKTIEILDLEVVVMQDEVLVRLIVALFRKLLATSAVEFLYYD